MAANLEYIVRVQDRDLRDLQRRIRETNRAFSGVGTGLGRANRDFDNFGRRANSTIRGVRRSLLSLGGITAGAGLAAGFASTIKQAAGFQQQLNVLQAAGRATNKEMRQVQATAKRLGADIRLPATSARDAADAMTELVKGGLSVNQTLRASRGVLQLSAAAQISNAEAAQITARALSAFGLAGGEATRVADLLAASANESTASISDMAFALSQSSAVARQAGLSVSETTTALTVLAKAGIVGSDAGTSLRVMLQRLVPQTKKSAEMMAELGVSAFDAQGKLRPISDVIDDYNRALSKLGPAQRATAVQTIFGTDAARAANIVFGQSADTFDKLEKRVSVQGEAARNAAARNKGFAGAMDAVQSSIQTAQITLGTAFLPTLEKLSRQFATFMGDPNTQRRLEEFGQFVGRELPPFLIRVGNLLRTVKQRAEDVSGALGGWKNAFSLILGGLLIRRLGLLAGAFLTLKGRKGGGGITGADVAALGLLKTLGRLKAFGPIVIPLLIAKKFQGGKGGNLADRLAERWNIEPGSIPGLGLLSDDPRGKNLNRNKPRPATRVETVAADRFGVKPTLGDDIKRANTRGLAITSGKRGEYAGPGKSLHKGGYAIDVAGGSDEMKNYAIDTAGRPGIAMVIYCHGGANDGRPGQGVWLANGFREGTGRWQVASSAFLPEKHVNHVHVGIFTPDERGVVTTPVSTPQSQETALTRLASGSGGMVPPVAGMTGVQALASARRIGAPGQGTHSRTEGAGPGGFQWQDDEAVDIEVTPLTRIVAVADGTLSGAKYGGATGRFSGWGVTLTTKTSKFFYKHMSELLVKEGEVRKGDVIGIGSTMGHLHFARQGAGTAEAVLAGTLAPARATPPPSRRRRTRGGATGGPDTGTGAGADTGGELLPLDIREQLVRAEGTLKNTKDDIDAFKRARDFLAKLLRGATGERALEIRQVWNDYRQRIASGRDGTPDKKDPAYEAIRLAIANAKLTTRNLNDDITALEREEALLVRRLRTAKGETRIDLTERLAGVRGDITGVRETQQRQRPRAPAPVAAIQTAAQRFNLDPAALLALARVESGSSGPIPNPRARGDSGTGIGLFQIGLRPDAAGAEILKKLGFDRAVKFLMDPLNNALEAAKQIAAAGGRGLRGSAAVDFIVDKFLRPREGGIRESERTRAKADIPKARQFLAGFGAGAGAGAGGGDGTSEDEARAGRAAAERYARSYADAARRAREAVERLRQRETARTAGLGELKTAVQGARIIPPGVKLEVRNRWGQVVQEIGVRQLQRNIARVRKVLETTVDPGVIAANRRRLGVWVGLIEDAVGRGGDVAAKRAEALQQRREEAERRGEVIEQRLGGTRQAGEILNISNALPAGLELQIRDRFQRIVERLNPAQVAAKVRAIRDQMRRTLDPATLERLQGQLQQYEEIIVGGLEEVRRQVEERRGMLEGALGDIAERAFETFDAKTEGMVEGIATHFERLRDVIDRELRDSLGTLDRWREELTPAEGLLRDQERTRDAAESATRIATANRDLERAEAQLRRLELRGASERRLIPAREAVAGARREVDATRADAPGGLRETAEMERRERDRQAEERRDALEAEADARREGAEAARREQEKQLRAERTELRRGLAARLQTIQQHVLEGRITADQATGELVGAFAEYGVAMEDSGLLLGSAFLVGFETAMRALPGLVTKFRNDLKTLGDLEAPDPIEVPIYFGGSGYGRPGFGKPLPMARGGIVTRPTVTLSGEAGPEAIIPLNRAGGLGGGTTHIHVSNPTFVGTNLENVVDELYRGLQRRDRRNAGLHLNTRR